MSQQLSIADFSGTERMPWSCKKDLVRRDIITEAGLCPGHWGKPSCLCKFDFNNFNFKHLIVIFLANGIDCWKKKRQHFLSKKNLRKWRKKKKVFPPIWFVTPLWETMKYPEQKHTFWAVIQPRLYYPIACANILCVEVMNCKKWNCTEGPVQGVQVRAM